MVCLCLPDFWTDDKIHEPLHALPSSCTMSLPHFALPIILLLPPASEPVTPLVMSRTFIFFALPSNWSSRTTIRRCSFFLSVFVFPLSLSIIMTKTFVPGNGVLRKFGVLDALFRKTTDGLADSTINVIESPLMLSFGRQAPTSSWCSTKKPPLHGILPCECD